jgi:glycosyltransferase involved in cell wall biosynthesis
LRLLYVTPAYPPFAAGGERYIRSLAQELARQGHEIVVVTSAAAAEPAFWQGAAVGSPERDGPIEVIRCPLRPFTGGRAALMFRRKLMVLVSALPGDQTRPLLKLARSFPPIQSLEETLARLPRRFDLVHGFNLSWEYPLVAGWDYARSQSLPFVATPFAHLGVTGRDRVARNSTMDHQRHVLADADAVLTLTPLEKEGLARHAIPADRMSVLGGGMDPLPEPADAEAVLRQRRLEQPLLLFIGRLTFDKGAIHAARATLLLRQRGLRATLALVGQPTAEFSRFYRQLPAEAQAYIRPLGLVSEPEKHALLSATRLLLLPSRSDSFGIVLLEAWAYGKPVVAARSGGIPGVVNDGQDGLLAPFGDVPALASAAARLLTDPAEGAKLGATGRARLERDFNWRLVAERALAVYRQLLPGPAV